GRGVNVADYIRLKLGNGNNMRFWDDKCLDNSFRRRVRSGIEEMQYNSLVEISRMNTLVQCEDRYVWTLESDEVFSVASIRKEIDGKRFQDVSLSTRWVKSVPIKVNIIAWKVKSNAFPTRFNISHRGMDIDSIVCPICNAGVETTNLLFFQCNVVRQIMRKISSWWNVDYLDVNSYEEWRACKYVTMVRHNQTGDAVSCDALYDSLVQFEPHVLASKAKKAAKTHDPLALIAHSNASSSQSYANSSYSSQSYYVTHPSSVVNYDDEYQGELQGDSQEDKLTTAMILLARAISQKFSSPTNSYGGNANNNAGRNKNQVFNAGNTSDESNQIIQRWVSDEEPEAPEEASQSLEQAPPSSDYMSGPENPPSSDYVPGPEYPEYLVPSDDEDDDDDDDEEEDEKEEEHLALADSTTLPAINPVPSAEDTKAFKTDESAPTPLLALKYVYLSGITLVHK
nr:RNA-directed DNA polymerase, eukaryota [Tanacetum cinerariifolium]